MLKTEGIIDVIFPSRNLEKDTDVIEIIKRIHGDPRGIGELESLKYLSQYYLLVGEFERALLVCHLLQDFKKILTISKATNIVPLMNVFAKGYLNSKVGSNLHKYNMMK